MQFILIFIGLTLFTLLTCAAYAVYAERRIAARIQQRVGPNRVGPWGLLQPLADVIKLLLKEDIVPFAANRFVHFLGPLVSTTIAMITIAVVPFADNLVIADVNIGILYILALTSLGVYGVTLGGWSSNSKYSLLGGLRSSAQMISYEISMGLAVVSVILITNYFSSSSEYLKLSSVVDAQHGIWNVFRNPLGFLIFVTCAFAECNRAPFDLVEAEQELVGGFHTEYSSMKFALFFVAEYMNVIVASAVISTMFFGGYQIPFGKYFMDGMNENLVTLLQLGSFMLKTFFFVFVFIWVRWTLPRFKYNQLMNIGWKFFLPLALLNLLLVAGGLLYYKHLF